MCLWKRRSFRLTRSPRRGRRPKAACLAYGYGLNEIHRNGTPASSGTPSAHGRLCRPSDRAIITFRPLGVSPFSLPRSQGSSMTPESAPAALERPPNTEVPLPRPSPPFGILDLLFIGIVCALAFLLASTPARNSDLWLHLASGRLTAQGRFSPGTDPFASTTQGVYWVNHSWLSDFLFYEVYKLGDGRALVLAKAVLIMLLAGMFFCFRRRVRGRKSLLCLRPVRSRPWGRGCNSTFAGIAARGGADALSD